MRRRCRCWGYGARWKKHIVKTCCTSRGGSACDKRKGVHRARQHAAIDRRQQHEDGADSLALFLYTHAVHLTMRRKHTNSKRPRGLHASFRVTEMPELMAILRREVGQILRDMADDEDPRVAARLREIAALFETGQLEEP